MANNYTTFSEVLVVETDEQKAWLENFMKPWELPDIEEGEDGEDREDGKDELELKKARTKWCEEHNIPRAEGHDYDDFDIEDWPNFQWEFSGTVSETEKKKEHKAYLAGNEYKPIQTAPWSLWVNSGDESGTPDHVATVVQACFKRFQIDSTFTLTWADTCSKLRVSEFSGGGFIVMPFGKSVKWSTPYMLFEKVKKQLAEKKATKSAKSTKTKKESRN